MVIKRERRTRRSRKTRSRIALSSLHRMTIFKSNTHIYAQVMDSLGSKILASASSNEPSLRKGNTGNIESASKVGELIAERAIEKGIKEVAFDRSGYKYHGRVKALAESARKSGLTF